MRAAVTDSYPQESLVLVTPPSLERASSSEPQPLRPIRKELFNASESPQPETEREGSR